MKLFPGWGNHGACCYCPLDVMRLDLESPQHTLALKRVQSAHGREIRHGCWIEKYFVDGKMLLYPWVTQIRS